MQAIGITNFSLFVKYSVRSLIGASMMRLPFHEIFYLALLFLGLLSLCQCKTTSAPAIKIASASKNNGCISGFVTDAEGEGLSSVEVETKPQTTPTITDHKGFFEICERRKVVNKELGETVKAPLRFLSYKLFVKRQGFKSKNNFTAVEYQGKKIHLKIRLTERGTSFDEVKTRGEGKKDKSKKDLVDKKPPPRGS